MSLTPSCMLTCSPYNQFDAIAVFTLIVIFFIDIVINFFLAYHEPSQRRMITDLAMIRARYLRLMFWVDLIALLPWDLIVMAGMGINTENDLGPPGTSLLPSYIAVLKWITLLRMYRAVEVFVK